MFSCVFFCPLIFGVRLETWLFYVPCANLPALQSITGRSYERIDPADVHFSQSSLFYDFQAEADFFVFRSSFYVRHNLL